MGDPPKPKCIPFTELTPFVAGIGSSSAGDASPGVIGACEWALLVARVEPEVGVGGTSAGGWGDDSGVYLPMNQDGTQPRSPFSSLIA